MTTLTEFLTARLDEDEAVALAAAKDAAGYSHGYPNDPISEWRINDEGDLYADHIFLAGGAYGGGIDEKFSAHLVRHDPARVLREVAAKRRVMERHRLPNEDERHRYWGSDGACAGCGVSGYTDALEWIVDDINDCPELRDLAAPYSDHPQFDPNWSTT